MEAQASIQGDPLERVVMNTLVTRYFVMYNNGISLGFVIRPGTDVFELWGL